MELNANSESSDREKIQRNDIFVTLKNRKI